MRTISNLSSKGVSFLFFTLASYHFIDTNVAGHFVAASSIVGLICIFAAPLNLMSLSKGKNYLNLFGLAAFFLVVLVLALRNFISFVDEYSISLLLITMLFYRALTDYYFVIQDRFVSRNIAHAVLFGGGIACIYSDISFPTIISAMVFIDLLMQRALLDARFLPPILDQRTSSALATISTNLVMKWDNLVMLSLVSISDSTQALSLLHFNQLFTVVAALRLSRWMRAVTDFMEGRRLALYRFLLSNMVFLIISCVVISVLFVLFKDWHGVYFWLSLMVIFVYRFTCQDTNLIANLIDFRLPIPVLYFISFVAFFFLEQLLSTVFVACLAYSVSLGFILTRVFYRYVYSFSNNKA